jgi:hypothetical protein
MTTSPRIGPEPAPGATPFQNFDKLFRRVISAPKEAVDKAIQVEERAKKRKRRAKKRG